MQRAPPAAWIGRRELCRRFSCFLPTSPNVGPTHSGDLSNPPGLIIANLAATSTSNSEPPQRPFFSSFSICWCMIGQNTSLRGGWDGWQIEDLNDEGCPDRHAPSRRVPQHPVRASPHRRGAHGARRDLLRGTGGGGLRPRNRGSLPPREGPPPHRPALQGAVRLP